MKHAFIAPIEYLDCIPEESNYHLLLAHLLKDERYCDFYRKRKERGDFIIIDNGAFEFHKPMDPHQYMELIVKSGISPDVIVAPDYPFKDWRYTVDYTKEFLDIIWKDPALRDMFNGVHVMGVPQSEEGDVDGWIKCHNELCLIPEIDFIGISILGVPNAFKSMTRTEDITINRNFASYFIKKAMRSISPEIEALKKELEIPERLPKVRYHYLGCGDPRELVMMTHNEITYGNDSSTAIWHGIQKIKFDNTYSGLKDGKTKIPVDFFIGRSQDPEVYACIRYNIDWIKSLIGK